VSTAGRETGESIVVMSRQAIATAVHQLAREIANGCSGPFVLLGILRRGRPLAERIAARIGEMTGHPPRVGSLSTTLYRDDLRTGKGRVKAGAGETHFDFDVDGATVVLVDDVISKGRTIRAALDEVMDYGRPARIQLACLIDRGHRELPIQPDYLGWTIATAPGDHVRVLLDETDGEDVVLLERATPHPADETDVVNG
jgi:pyrimidine operon attenuation protein/uracil phosphoribosyltransferase